MTKLTQQFFKALSVCVGDEPIKARLSQAWTKHLDSIDCDNMPRSIRADFRELRTAMYQETPRSGEHPAHASVRKMSAKQAAYHSRTIASIFGLLSMLDQYQADCESGDIVVHIAESYSKETDRTLN